MFLTVLPAAVFADTASLNVAVPANLYTGVENEVTAEMLNTGFVQTDDKIGQAVITITGGSTADTDWYIAYVNGAGVDVPLDVTQESNGDITAKIETFPVYDATMTLKVKPEVAGSYSYTVAVGNTPTGAGVPTMTNSGAFDVVTTFVSVAGITGVPTTVTAGTDLTLNGTVDPTNATNQTIVWSVVNAGTTGATITGAGDVLSTTAKGIVTVRATITDGLAVGMDYTDTFNITVSAASPFVAVIDITGVPTTATAGTNLTLNGTVNPTNATNQTIVWSVDNAGTTGATIVGDVLSTTAAGTVTVRATITDGLAVGTDYTDTFPITVNAASLAFVAVSGITGIPTTATAGTDLTLSGTVAPTNATNQTIVWSVDNAGTTGATITTGGVLSTTAAGTVIVKAKIIDGSAVGTDYERPFSITVNATPLTTHTVIFVDYDGTVLATQTVNAGDSATAPADPKRDGYTFNGWDTSFTNVTGPLTVRAVYSPISATAYTVVFRDYDGTVLDTQTVNAGGSAVAPSDPTRAGYTFTGWNISFSNVTSNLTITAVYELAPIPSSGAYGISPDTLAFGPVLYGYDPVNPQIIVIANTGNVDWENVTVTLDGNNADSFEIISPSGVFTIPANETVGISVSPIDELAAGSYSAGLLITGGGSELRAVLTFTVNPQPVTGGAITLSAPVRGVAPAATVTIGDFTLPVDWTPTVGATFAARTAYTATIILPDDPNYSLAGLTTNSFTIPGATSVIYNPATRTITAVFPQTTGTSGSSSGGGSATIVEEEVPLAALPTISYIYGADRVETAIAISKAGWTSAEAVILAPGDNDHIIDALSVSSLAGQDDAPILLVLNNSIRESVFTEIARLGAGKTYVVGSLGQGVADQLKARFPAMEIIVLQGANRVETAKLINARVTTPQGTFVVGYGAIADAVSAASFAAANGYVIQIAASDAAFGGDASLGGYVLGGPTLVQDVSGLTRIYGADRYATNQGMRDSLTFMYDNVYFANGVTLVDALTGSALAAKSRAVILLTPQNDPAGLNLGPVTPETKVYGFGGPAA
jgi:putative cell wall-binding protein